MKILLLGLIKLYQMILSPLLGKHCRFFPTCSHYCYGAICKYGVWSGLWRGIKRLLKCGPWHKGGVDFP